MGVDFPSSFGLPKLMICARLNSNTIPVTAWAIMEIIRDKALFRDIRNEALSAFSNGVLDNKKVIELPLLLSVYHECLRLHVSVNITRVIDEDMSLDGYALRKNYLVQMPSWISHHDEGIWSVPDHPATEFWAQRHLKYVESIEHQEIEVPSLNSPWKGDRVDSSLSVSHPSPFRLEARLLK